WTSVGPKRAGVSSFGFGGTNFHAVLEEYTGEFRPAADRPPTLNWPAELFYWEGDSAESLARDIQAFAAHLEPDQPLASVASRSWLRAGTGGHRASIVAASAADLTRKAELLCDWLRSGD